MRPGGATSKIGQRSVLSMAQEILYHEIWPRNDAVWISVDQVRKSQGGQELTECGSRNQVWIGWACETSCIIGIRIC